MAADAGARRAPREAGPDRPRLAGPRLPWLGRAAPLVVYAALAVGLTWPAARDGTTHFISNGGDARHQLWILWHVREALLGREPLLSTPLLYFPLGASLLTNAQGPLMGVLAAPLWVWGPEVAYNAALVLSSWLTGYCMYLLARGLGFDRPVALFAGVVLMAAPIRQAAVPGHLDRVFLGLPPLILLALHRALDPRRSAWWCVATVLGLLAILLHSGMQFVFMVLTLGYFLLWSWLSIGSADVRAWLRRSALIAGSAAILLGPLVLVLLDLTRDPTIILDLNWQSFNFQPDLVQLFIPALDSRAFDLLDGPRWDDKLLWPMETSIYLTWTGLALGMVALLRAGAPARRWLLFAGLCAVVSLGPALKVYGESRFTEYNLPIILPYAFLTELPGLEFMRTPGRFMMIGFVGLAIAASFGLAWLVGRWPRLGRPITALAAVSILAETWPKPWPRETLRPVPEFYRQLARDGELYGVFDLPIKPLATVQSRYFEYSSHYQMYQLIHRKGIAAGYLSRRYSDHPLFPCLFSNHLTPLDLTVDGGPSGCYVGARTGLARHGYRYVVWHKPRDDLPDYRPGGWGDRTARASLGAMFGEQAPLVDDDLVRVYAVSPAPETAPATVLEIGDNWRELEEGRRWATSPATLTVTSPREQTARLEITPLLFHDPRSPNGIGTSGVLRVRVGERPPIRVDVASDRPASVPLALQPGRQTIALALEAGNFRPRDYGGQDVAPFSFAIRSIDLRTDERSASPPAPLPAPGVGPAPAYAVEWLGHDVPARMQPGRAYAARATLRNAGRLTWPTSGSDGDPRKVVNIAYHWLSPHEGRTLVYDGVRTPLPHDVPPGGSLMVENVRLVAPRAPGTYLLQLTLVHELVTWFEQRGASTLVVPVTVGDERR